MDKKQINYKAEISSIRQNGFSVSVCDNKGNDIIFPYEIEYFHEEFNNKIVLKIRYNTYNIGKIKEIILKKHRYLPNFLIKKKNKFDITLDILNDNLSIVQSCLFSDCVIRKVTHPMFFYGKDSNRFATVYIEFEFNKNILLFADKSCLNKPSVVMDKSKYSKIIENSNLMLDYALENAKKHYKNKNNDNYLKNFEKEIHNAKKENNERLEVFNKFTEK